MSKNLSIIVVPHDNAKTWNLKFSYRLLYVFMAMAVVLGAVIAVFLFTYGKVLIQAENSATLSRENRELKHQAAQMDSLRLELINLQAMSIQIKRMLGVDLSVADSMLVANLSPVAKSPAISADQHAEAVGTDEQRMMLEAMPSMWPIKGYVTRGYRITGGDKDPNFHSGIDIAAQRNTPIQAAAEGVVVVSKFDQTFGWVVEIDHGYGIGTLYGHNTRNLVNVGDRVARGKTIAFVGSTGKSTAPHLHFEIKKDGVPVDPNEYLLN